MKSTVFKRNSVCAVRTEPMFSVWNNDSGLKAVKFLVDLCDYDYPVPRVALKGLVRKLVISDAAVG
jgi:hypothetical protein